jgi:hypothetical protein
MTAKEQTFVRHLQPMSSRSHALRAGSAWLRPTRRLLAIVTVTLMAVGPGCAGFLSNTVQPSLVERRAGIDLECDQVVVRQIDNTAWRATGCGQAISYQCWTSVGMGEGTCMRDGELAVVAAQ